MRKRVALVGNGPRCMMLKDGTAVVPTYFSDTLNIVDLNTANVQSVAHGEESYGKQNTAW